MLVNVPNTDDLNGIALRLYFDAWDHVVTLFSDFMEVCEISIEELDGEHDFEEEWGEYILQAQSEMGAICATIQQSAELRLKAIICGVSPYLLLLNGAVPLKAVQADIDFSEQRTLDAVDLPNAVRSFTEFNLPDIYIEQYSNLRRLRNQFTHLGSHVGGLTPRRLIELLSQQYVSLWPDGRWLFRRVVYDGNSARRFFHDERWSSVQSNVMAEMPYTLKLLSNETFKKCVGIKKGKLKGFCPACMYCRATKWDADGHATAYQTSASTASCAMCERGLEISMSENICENCDSMSAVEILDDNQSYGVICFDCGHG